MSDPSRTEDEIDLAASSEGSGRTAPEAGLMGQLDTDLKMIQYGLLSGHDLKSTDLLGVCMEGG